MKLLFRLSFALALVSSVTLAPTVMAKAVDACPFKTAGNASNKSPKQVQNEVASLLGQKPAPQQKPVTVIQ